jgi:hypothetical protein
MLHVDRDGTSVVAAVRATLRHKYSANEGIVDVGSGFDYRIFRKQPVDADRLRQRCPAGHHGA